MTTYEATGRASETLHHKFIMDAQGNWTLVPYALSRDDKGWHDRRLPETERKPQFLNAQMGDVQ